MHGNGLCTGSRELSTAFGPLVTQEDTEIQIHAQLGMGALPLTAVGASSHSSSLEQLSFPRARLGCEIFVIFSHASQ